MKGYKFILKHHFDGEPKDEDFELVEEDIVEELNEGGKLFRQNANTS